MLLFTLGYGLRQVSIIVNVIDLALKPDFNYQVMLQCARGHDKQNI